MILPAPSRHSIDPESTQSDLETAITSRHRFIDHIEENENSKSKKQQSPKATWVPPLARPDRRAISRSAAAFPVTITPLDDHLESVDPPQEGMVLNYSNAGICLEYSELILESYIRISWTSNSSEHEAMIRLKWCRSDGKNHYLAGGVVLNIE